MTKEGKKSVPNEYIKWKNGKKKKIISYKVAIFLGSVGKST